MSICLCPPVCKYKFDYGCIGVCGYIYFLSKVLFCLICLFFSVGVIVWCDNVCLRILVYFWNSACFADYYHFWFFLFFYHYIYVVYFYSFFNLVHDCIFREGYVFVFFTLGVFYVYVCGCVYVCMCVCVYAYVEMYVCVSNLVGFVICMCICILRLSACMFMLLWVLVYECICLYVFWCFYVFLFICIYIYIYINIYIYIHIYMLVPI